MRTASVKPMVDIAFPNTRREARSMGRSLGCWPRPSRNEIKVPSGMRGMKGPGTEHQQAPGQLMHSHAWFSPVGPWCHHVHVPGLRCDVSSG